MLNIPFLSQLESQDKILIAGAGGGFDVFSGIPLYLALRNAGKQVHLANLAFTDLVDLRDAQMTASMYRIEANTDQELVGRYFPEKFLAEWLSDELGEDIPIYTFARTGVIPLLDNYRILKERLNFDTVVLVDGGTDSLMRGDEDGLGTPQEDYCSIAAVDELNVANKYLLCLGFGVDHFHGVSNDLSLKAIAELTQKDAFLGMWSLLRGMPEVDQYIKCVDYVFSMMPYQKSIVSNSIRSALYGHYGNYHNDYRTEGSKLWINPLMTQYIAFKLQGVIDRCLYLDRLKNTETFRDLSLVIEGFRSGLQETVKRDEIPN